jgi:hypothetical protein
MTAERGPYPKSSLDDAAFVKNIYDDSCGCEGRRMEQKYNYSWQGVLQDAVLEINPEKRRAKVPPAEVAIFERAQALSLFGRGNYEKRVRSGTG